MGKPETPADQAAVAEQFPDLIGMGGGADVEIFWNTAQKQVTHTASNKVGCVPVTVETIEDLQGIGIDEGAGDIVFPAWNDVRLNASWQISW
jgi:hypothetical protein